MAVLCAAVAALLLGLLTAPAAPAAPAAEAASQARGQNFDEGWRFALVNTASATDPTGAYADAYRPSYDDSAWRTLDLPHDWAIERPPTTTGSTYSEGFYPGGLGWYRKTFTLPRQLAGKRLSLDFDGVYMDSSVYVNGQLAARHPYGYTGFEVDLSDLVHTDGTTPNTVAVKVVNQVQSSRWYSGSGIYRHVKLVATDRTHIARHGVTVTTPDLQDTYEDGYAKVRARTRVTGDDGTVTTTVYDAKGAEVARANGADAELRVSKPQLWSPDRPYRYTAVSTVRVGGKSVDSVRTRFGIRWFSFDPDHGFSLNGERTKLRGVNLHHTLGPLGAAVSEDAMRRQLTKMKEMGVNAVRTSHNPPAPEFVELCDELGLLLMVEAFDTWRTPKKPYDYGRFFDEHSDGDITEMVRAARNSPAVVMWSIGNEIPDGTSVEIGVPIARRLIDDIKAADPTRPVVIGSHSYTSVPQDGSAQDQILRMLDGVGLNYNSAKSIDALHAKYPNTFFFESESASATSARGAYQDPQWGNTAQDYTPGRREPSSYDNNMVSWASSGEHALKKDRDREFFAGQFIWSGQDYIGEPTPYNNVFPVKTSYFGAVDTAGFAKDQFYLYQSQWTSRPMVHLVPMDWTTHEPGEEVSVWAYSNAEKVELFLNGRSLGTRSFDRKTTAYGTEYLETTEQTGDDKQYPSGSYTSPNGSTGSLKLRWNVPFAKGELTAVAYRDGKRVAQDTVRTAGSPAGVRLRVERGKTLSFVTADVVDSRGVLVPYADNLVTFRAKDGRVVATDSGRQENGTSYASPAQRAFHGRVMAVVTTGSHVTATLGPASPAPPADASFSASATTPPEAMTDDDPVTGWSNLATKGASLQFPAMTHAHAREWVALNWTGERSVSRLTARFTTGGALTLPQSVRVTYWDGTRYVPAPGVRVTWADTSDAPSTFSFSPVGTSRLRLEMTSPTPGAATGFFRISELTAEP